MSMVFLFTRLDGWIDWDSWGSGSGKGVQEIGVFQSDYIDDPLGIQSYLVRRYDWTLLAPT